MPLLMELETIQSGLVKSTFEAMKEILNEANFEFDQNGLRILSMDPSYILAVHLSLEAENFEKYVCQKNLVLGINMVHFHKIIKTIGRTNTLRLFFDSSYSDRLGIEIYDQKENIRTVYYLNLIEHSQEPIDIPDIPYCSVMIIPSRTFHNICRNMIDWSDKIEIQSLDDQLVLKCDGDSLNQKTIIGASENGLSFVKTPNKNEIIQDVFSLKFLVSFTKCSNLCEVIYLHLENNKPLTIIYDVAQLGKIKLCLAPSRSKK